MTTPRLIAILLCAGLALGAAAAPPAIPTGQTVATFPTLGATDATLAQFFDDAMREAMDRLDIPGGAVIVVRDGRTILARGYGIADLATGKPVDVDTSLFRAASTSKLLVWLLAMQLVEQGRLDLDQDVNTYLDFTLPADHGVPVTMRHLMTHTAGYPERFHGIFDPDTTTPLAAKLRDNIPDQPYAPGSTVAYANYGAALAGYVIERLHDQPWEAIVEQRILGPLGMRHSTVAQPVPDPMRPLLVSTYLHGDARPVPFRTIAMAPAGSLSASAADMGRLLAMLVAGAGGVDGPLVSAGTVQGMMKVDHPLAPGLPDGLGLGFLVGEYRGVRYAGHAGNMSSLATDLEVLPGHALGWYYVFSSQGPGEYARKVREDLLHAVIDTFLAGQGAAPAERTAYAGPSSAADVAGSYISTRRLHRGPLMFSGLMNTTVATAQADGTLSIRSSGEVSTWLPDGTDRFVGSSSGTPLVASRGADGRVERIASAALSPVAEFERQPALAAAVPVVAAFSFAILLGSALLRPVAGAWRHWQQRRGRLSPAEASLPHAPLLRYARASFWLLFLTIAALAVVVLAIAIDFSILFDLPAAVRWSLAILVLSSGPLAFVLTADALLACVRSRGSAWSRLGGLLVALAAVAAACLFYTLDVWNFSSDW